jgi:hypothetical protein
MTKDDEKRMMKSSHVHQIEMTKIGLKMYRHIPSIVASHETRLESLLDEYEERYGEKYESPLTPSGK